MWGIGHLPHDRSAAFVSSASCVAQSTAITRDPTRTSGASALHPAVGQRPPVGSYSTVPRTAPTVSISIPSRRVPVDPFDPFGFSVESECFPPGLVG